MTNIDTLARNLRKRYKILKSWRAVAAEFQISAGMAYRMANEPGFEPKGAHIRAKLGLPALVSAPACPECGDVHVSKRCPNRPVKRQRPRRIAIRTDDAESAASSILRNLEIGNVVKLTIQLQQKLNLNQATVELMRLIWSYVVDNDEKENGNAEGAD